ncbi:MAG: hypothetical protein QOH35_5779, partial [Acidobacteriaceae bacterium]|nr:hypothetical protein [Acidobacteriaceae bacterium]
PGTANAPATDLATSKNYPSAVTLSVAGAQATNINYLMDGGDNNDAFTNVNLPFPFPDAIQEFSVQTSGLSPQYGVPFTATTGTDASLTAVGQDRPNLIGKARAQNTPITTWLARSSFAANTAGTYGTTRPYEFYGPHYTNVDTALSKFIPLHEALQLEARAECFNCLNHTNFANPGGAINGAGTGVTNPGTALSAGTFGTITAANPPRILQLSLKMDF